jgi:hypothetical protein
MLSDSLWSNLHGYQGKQQRLTSSQVLVKLACNIQQLPNLADIEGSPSSPIAQSTNIILTAI